MYVIYSRKSKEEKTRLVNAIGKGLSVKTYNADLLVVADYSAKQKAIARFGAADVVVLLPGTPMKALKGTTIRAPLLLARNLEMTVQSDQFSLHIVAKRTNLAFMDGVVVLEVAKEEDLASLDAIRASNVVRVDETAIDVARVISLITDRILKRS